MHIILLYYMSDLGVSDVARDIALKKNFFKFSININSAYKSLFINISDLNIYFKLWFAFNINVITLNLSSITDIIIVKTECEI